MPTMPADIHDMRKALPALLADANKTLKEIDLDGILDFDGLKYTLDHSVLQALAARGAKVNLGRKTAW